MRSALVDGPVLLGALQPRIRCVPPYVSSAGFEAIEVYELTGNRLDRWQKDALIDAQGERADGRWAAFEVGLNVARQNGKDEIILARELAGLFAWDERMIIHSAHLFDTAMEHLERLVALIEACGEFSRRVRKVNRSHGSEGITLTSGARIRFRARTRSGGGRGYTGDLVVLNEAMDIPDPLVGSMMPVMSARSTRVPGPQIYYAGSAVDQTTMANGHVFTRVREAAVAGANDRLAYFEFSAAVREWLGARGLRFDESRPEIEQVTSEMCADPEMWAQANPAMGVRISPEHVATEFRSPGMSLRQFAVERLGIGDPPIATEGSGRVISREDWAACAERDQANRIASRWTFAIDTNVDQTWGVVAVAGGRADGLLQVAVVRHDRGANWIVGLCETLHERHPGAEFVIDKRGPAANLISELVDVGIDPVETSTQDYGDACADFVADVMAGKLRFPFPQPELDEALASARKQPMGDRWKWARRSSTSADISPLIGVTLARWGVGQGAEAARDDWIMY